MFSREAPTVFSDIVYPGISALVDSHISRVTPFCPSSPSLVISIISPSTGVRSSLKSPECITIPRGVFIARQQASAIEWFT